MHRPKKPSLQIPSILFLFLLIALCTNCTSNSITHPLPKYLQKSPDERLYLFLGHTYRISTQDEIDPQVAQLDLSLYDEIWLGGDLIKETTKFEHPLPRLDSLFNLKAPTTHWAVGNHDLRNGSPEKIEAATGRPLFYTHTQNGITRTILNTCLQNPQDDDLPGTCEERAAQWEMLKNVTDTLKNSTHLILLMHHVWFSEENLEANPAGSVNYRPKQLSFLCDSTTTFGDSLMPRLKKLNQRGIQTICISGDFGQQITRFQWPAEDGIVFLGQGLNRTTAELKNKPGFVKRSGPDRVLLFRHNLRTGDISWETPFIESLPKRD